jgi:hypothetical protein
MNARKQDEEASKKKKSDSKKDTSTIGDKIRDALTPDFIKTLNKAFIGKKKLLNTLLTQNNLR